jgi:hypothetical protein
MKTIKTMVVAFGLMIGCGMQAGLKDQALAAYDKVKSMVSNIAEQTPDKAWKAGEYLVATGVFYCGIKAIQKGAYFGYGLMKNISLSSIANTALNLGTSPNTYVLIGAAVMARYVLKKSNQNNEQQI